MAPADPAAGMFSPQDTRSADALRRRYHQLIKLYHPDRHTDRPEWANRMVRAVIAAYNTLKTAPRTAVVDLPVDDVRAVIGAADEDVRRAVLLGWIRHCPRRAGDRALRRRIAAARDSIRARSRAAADAAPTDFYDRFLAVFLEATDPARVGLQPYLWNAPHLFRDLRLANSLLEKGIRGYYHYRERGRLEGLGGVALSYLADASRLYSRLSRAQELQCIREVAQSRIAMASAFAQRISLSDPG